MKKIIVTLFIFSLILTVHSAPRSLPEAEIVCDNFLNLLNKPANIATSTHLKSNEVELFVFNLAETGWMITSCDDVFFPVIAYSQTGRYDQESSNDLQFRFILEDIRQRKGFYQAYPDKAALNQAAWTQLLEGSRPPRPFQQWPMPGNTFTEGWCNTQWSQTGMFNQFCPVDDESGERCLVGCVATAMVQIINFHQYIGGANFNDYDDYYSGNILIDDFHLEYDFLSFEELNVYLDEVDFKYNSGLPLEEIDIAALSFAGGVSVKMSYGSEVSWAYYDDVVTAFHEKYGYESAFWLNNDGNSFYASLQENVKSMQPCELGIYTDGWNNGHAIVCDGYNTEDYYHLNYGWGTSNIGWYHIPDGMPSDYTIIGGGVCGIEGGEHPCSVSGSISGPPDLENSYILFTGESYSYEAYSSESGSFNLPAVKQGMYTVSAIQGRTWYYEEDIYIDENITDLDLDLFNYDALTGNIEVDIEPVGTNIALYEEDQMIAVTSCDPAGNFSIPDILPGAYLATASLSPAYFGYNSLLVNEENQFVTISLDHYPGTDEISFAGEPEATHSLVPIEISCAIKIFPEDLITHENDVFTGISFICPISPSEGQLTIMLWKDEEVLTMQEVTDFEYGSLIEAEFPVFIKVDTTSTYYAGYELETQSGEIAWHDAGPRLPGKGAWYKVSNWIEMNSIYDYNFCLTANLISSSVDNSNSVTPADISSHFSKIYPNPFSLSSSRSPINIGFELTSSSQVDISLYNPKGQKVTNIYRGNLSAGKKAITWQPSNLNTGIYFYRLKTDKGDIDHQKTIIIN